MLRSVPWKTQSLSSRSLFSFKAPYSGLCTTFPSPYNLPLLVNPNSLGISKSAYIALLIENKSTAGRASLFIGILRELLEAIAVPCVAKLEERQQRHLIAPGDSG